MSLFFRCLALLFAPLTAVAQPLVELQALALDHDPGLRAARAARLAAEQRVVQARAAFGPTASFSASGNTTRYTELPEQDKRGFKSGQWAVQVNQPLWRGGLYPALQAAEAQLEQTEAALQLARAEALQRFTEALLEVLKSRDTLRFTETLREAQGEQLAAARRSYQVGRAAITEVREAEARRDAAEAQGVAAEAELELRQQVLAELLGGQSVPGLLALALDPDAFPQLDRAAILDWLGEAERHSPSLRQARQALLAAEAEVRKASLAHAPSVDLSYSYTHSNDTGTVTSFFPRRGNASTYGVTLTIPLFASGATQSRVVEAQALREKADSEVDLARRTLSLGLRQAFVGALSAGAQARSLAAAERSQELSLRANLRGFEVGLKTNAEVLEAQSKLFEARRDLSRARHDAWAAYFRLRALSGLLDENDIAQFEARLLPAPPVAPLRGRRPS